MLNDQLIAVEIEITYADEKTVQVMTLAVAPDTTIENALRQSGIPMLFDAVGIFGELKSLQTVVKAGDRVELYRALPQTPMALRKAKTPRPLKRPAKPRQRPVTDPR